MICLAIACALASGALGVAFADLCDRACESRIAEAFCFGVHL